MPENKEPKITHGLLRTTFRKIKETFTHRAQNMAAQQPLLEKPKPILSARKQYKMDIKLLKAVISRNIEKVEKYLDMGADVNCRLPYKLAISPTFSQSSPPHILNPGYNMGSTPLIIAASLANRKICELLLGRGADVNAVDVDGKSAFIYASYSYILACCDVLVENGADVFLKDNKDQDALIYSILSRNFSTSLLLIKKYNADKDWEFRTGLLNVASQSDNLEDVEYLLSIGANPMDVAPNNFRKFENSRFDLRLIFHYEKHKTRHILDKYYNLWKQIGPSSMKILFKSMISFDHLFSLSRSLSNIIKDCSPDKVKEMFESL